MTIQKTVEYLEPQLQKIEDCDTGISYWRIELELEGETPEGLWLVVESPELHDALKCYKSSPLVFPNRREVKTHTVGVRR
jgi:hypothetical protein